MKRGLLETRSQRQIMLGILGCSGATLDGVLATPVLVRKKKVKYMYSKRKGHDGTLVRHYGTASRVVCNSLFVARKGFIFWATPQRLSARTPTLYCAAWLGHNDPQRCYSWGINGLRCQLVALYQRACGTLLILETLPSTRQLFGLR